MLNSYGLICCAWIPPPAAKPNSPAHENRLSDFTTPVIVETKGKIKAGDWDLGAHRAGPGRPAAATSYPPAAAETASRSNASKAPSALALPQADPRPAGPTGAAAAKGAARNDEAAAIGASSLGGLRLRPRCRVAAVSFM